MLSSPPSGQDAGDGARTCGCKSEGGFAAHSATDAHILTQPDDNPVPTWLQSAANLPLIRRKGNTSLALIHLHKPHNTNLEASQCKKILAQLPHGEMLFPGPLTRITNGILTSSDAELSSGICLVWEK
ncbi:hypothetical protein PoB_006519500 [Plakobranchus ocellatus]|uniref:Uncharacterized protein n=1 Tax=Plakobranchus ocellatus TaxID=259542 RepID=A0AAV4D3L5_9GAST|nr:hypothetical protein PoB_006519500 [Plakobranchus ocellatus]